MVENWKLIIPTQVLPDVLKLKTNPNLEREKRKRKKKKHKSEWQITAEVPPACNPRHRCSFLPSWSSTFPQIPPSCPLPPPPGLRPLSLHLRLHPQVSAPTPHVDTHAVEYPPHPSAVGNPRPPMGNLHRPTAAKHPPPRRAVARSDWPCWSREWRSPSRRACWLHCWRATRAACCNEDGTLVNGWRNATLCQVSADLLWQHSRTFTRTEHFAGFIQTCYNNIPGLLPGLNTLQASYRPVITKFQDFARTKVFWGPWRIRNSTFTRKEAMFFGWGIYLSFATLVTL